MELRLEKVDNQAKEGIYISHCRAKQRSDKRETRFLIPKNAKINYTGVVEEYLTHVKTSLNLFTGRMFFTGTSVAFFKQPIGKNTISKVPNEMASLLELESPNLYTFHSLRRSSATAAADGGASVQQLMDFYGWSNSNMPQEYVSSSKASVRGMADRLLGIEAEGESSSVNRELQSSKLQQQYVFEKSDKIVIVENVTCQNFSL